MNEEWFAKVGQKWEMAKERGLKNLKNDEKTMFSQKNSKLQASDSQLFRTFAAHSNTHTT